MLLTRLFIIQAFFQQILYYFNYNGLVRAEEPNSENILSFYEDKTLFLSAFVTHRYYKDWQNEDFFPGVQDSRYIPVAAFYKELYNIDILEKRLSGATLEICSWDKGDTKSTTISLVNNQYVSIFSYQRDVDVNELQVKVKKHVFGSILNKIKSNHLHERTKVFLQLSNPKREKIWIIDIYSPTPGALDMYWYKKNLLEEDIKNKLGIDFLLYPSNNKRVYIYIINLLKRHLIDENNMKIIKDGNKFNLHIDEMPTVFLCYEKKIFHVEFLGEFILKIKPYKEQDSGIEIVEKFFCTPSIVIEFSKTNNNSKDYINFQINEHLYDESIKSYSWINDIDIPLYKNINFGNKSTITSESKGISLQTLILTPKTIPVIEMVFEKVGLFYKDEVYASLKESINEIIIYINGKEDKKVVIDNNLFEINDGNQKFEICLNFAKLESNNTFTLLNLLVIDRDVDLRILVRTKTESIIESIVCLDRAKMFVVSSNKLIEFLDILKDENSKGEDGDENSRNENSKGEDGEENSKNENSNGEDDENTRNENDKGEDDENTRNENSRGKDGGENTRNENSKGEDDNTTPPSQPSIPIVGASSSVLTKKVDFKLPQKEQPLAENNAKFNNRKTPQKAIAQGSTLNRHTIDQNETKQLMNQDRNADKPDHTFESEVPEFIHISFVKQKDLGVFFDNNALNKPIYLQKPNNTNPTIGVTGTTAPDVSTENVIKPASENTTTASEDTFKNKGLKSTKTTITIFFVVGGVFGIGGLIIYMNFF